MIIALLLLVLALRPSCGAEASFSRDIAPILQSKCAGCHGPEKSKGGYRVDSYGALLKPGTSKERPVVPGEPDESALYQRLTAVDADDRMPQKDEPLPAAQLALFRSWLAGGAALDRGETNTPLAALLPRRPHPAPPEKYPRPYPVLALAFAPGEEQLAVGGLHEVTFWNYDGALQRRLTNIPQRVRSMAFLPAGRIAVAGGHPGRSGELSIYNLESGLLETNLLATPDEILCVAASADGQRLACGGTDNAIYVFDLPGGARTARIQQHADWVCALAFNSPGSKIASASRDRTARLYDAAAGTLETTYVGLPAALNIVSFLPDGTVVTGGRGKSLHLWNPADGKKSAEIGGFSDDVLALAAASDSLFTATADGSLRQHSLRNRKLERTLAPSGPAIFSLACDSSAKRLAAGNYDGAVTIWNVTSGEIERTFTAAPGWSSRH